MLHHYITKYWDVDEGALYVEAWLQLNIFDYCFCFSRRRKKKSPPKHCTSAMTLKKRTDR